MSIQHEGEVACWACWAKGITFIGRATILSLFLRIVLILKYYGLENIIVLNSKKFSYMLFASLIFLIFIA